MSLLEQGLIVADHGAPLVEATGMSEPTKEPAGPSKTEVWITRTTAILAVLAALSSGRWGASNLWAILEQGKVNDAWSYYQAKSIKQHMARDSAELAEALHGDAALIASFRTEAKRLDADKTKSQQDAETFERSRNRRVEQSFWFEISFACIQLGVVICTIATATRSKGMWAAAIFLGLVGLGIFTCGMLVKEATVENALTKSMTKAMDGSVK